MSTAGKWGYWIADAVAVAARAEWSPDSLTQLIGQIGHSVAATQGQIAVGASRAEWRSPSGDPTLRGHLCEFSSGELDPWQSDPVEVFLGVEHPSMESEYLVELVGNLVCGALAIGVGVSAIQMRAELLRLVTVGESHKQQAAGLLAERFQCSVGAAARRLEDTASRFQISPVTFAVQLLGSSC
jgi:hypothetical protein